MSNSYSKIKIGLVIFLINVSLSQVEAQITCQIKMLNKPTSNLDSLEEIAKKQLPSSLRLLEKLVNLEYSRGRVDSEKFGNDFNRIKQLSDRLKNPYGTAIYYYLSGRKAINTRKLPEAFDFYTKALSYFTANKDTVGMILTNNALGSVNITYFGDTTGDAQVVLKHAEESLRLAKLTKNDELVAIALGSFSNYYNLPQHRNLVKLENIELQKLTTLSRNPKLRPEFIATSINLSAVYFYQNQFKKGYNLLKQNYEEAKAISQSEHFRVYVNNLAIACTYIERFDEAERYLKEALVMSKKVPDNLPYLQSVYQNFQDLYRRKKDFETALAYADSVVAIKDSTALIENSQQLNSIQTQYQTKQKEIENAALKTQNKLMTERNNSYLVLIVIFAAAATVIFLLWFKLRVSNQQLDELLITEKKLNLTKDKVFSVISHDLKQPISELTTLVTVWDNPALTPHQKQQTIAEIRGALNNTNFVLDNLLQWSIAELKNTNLVTEPVDLKTLVEQAVQQATPSAQRKQISILTDVKSMPVEVNPNQILIAFRNLLNNAVKFTPKEGFIRIATERVGLDNIVKFRDSGIGIEAKLLSQIFSYPNSTHGTEGEVGTGIGLTMSKELVEVNGGKINIKSKIGTGTEVSICFPLV